MIIRVTYRRFNDDGPVEFEQVDHTEADNLTDAMRQLQRYARSANQIRSFSHGSTVMERPKRLAFG